MTGSVDPMTRLAGLGSADLAAGVGFLLAAARAGVPVLLDGVVSLAEVAIAEELEPGLIGWCAAGHRSTEPAQQVALEKLGLDPLLDLGLRLGEGTGAPGRRAGAPLGGPADPRGRAAVGPGVGGVRLPMALEGLRLAAGTLTVLPSGPIPEIDKPMAARAMVLAPLAVVPLAAAAVLVAWGAPAGRVCPS